MVLYQRGDCMSDRRSWIDQSCCSEVLNSTSVSPEHKALTSKKERHEQGILPCLFTKPVQYKLSIKIPRFRWSNWQSTQAYWSNHATFVSNYQKKPAQNKKVRSSFHITKRNQPKRVKSVVHFILRRKTSPKEERPWFILYYEKKPAQNRKVHGSFPITKRNQPITKKSVVHFILRRKTNPKQKSPWFVSNYEEKPAQRRKVHGSFYITKKNQPITKKSMVHFQLRRKTSP